MVHFFFKIILLVVLLNIAMPQFPTSQPTRQPSRQPSSQPTRIPTSQPSRQPTRQPTAQPSRSPTRQPSSQPSRQPTGQPSRNPTNQPSSQPSCQPTSQPTTPSCSPTGQPTRQPSRRPTGQPTRVPTRQPTSQPSRHPTGQPTRQPSRQPSSHPTGAPVLRPTAQPSRVPTNQPTKQPINSPTGQPSSQPSIVPSIQPTSLPSIQPSRQPISRPTTQPSRRPTSQPTRQPFRRPSSQPSRSPTRQPTGQPSRQPSIQPFSKPTSNPSCQPSSIPSILPSAQPSRRPTSQPVMHPSVHPSNQPSGQPSLQPLSKPSTLPSRQPSSIPSHQPTSQPSMHPSQQPNSFPSGHPTLQPYSNPSGQPTIQPSSQPSRQPYCRPTSQPSRQPTRQPTGQPTRVPTSQPTRQPSRQPTSQPSRSPTRQPTSQPSRSPTNQPTRQPTRQPTAQPSRCPTRQPTRQPTQMPSVQPTSQPSVQPSSRPSCIPTLQPTTQPSLQPTSFPSDQPSSQPSRIPTHQPSNQPTSVPTSHPTTRSTGQPSSRPSGQPSQQPTRQPTFQPSVIPSSQPSAQPQGRPSGQPTKQPSSRPSGQPSSMPSRQPSGQPTLQPTLQPSCQPSSFPTCQPTSRPSRQPTKCPSQQPTSLPSCQPSSLPSCQPFAKPTSQPSLQPTSRPSRQPSSQPSRQPSSQPSASPTRQPTSQPSKQPLNRPTGQPSRQPTGQPTRQPSRRPTGQPTRVPTCQPTSQPIRRPSSQPTRQPTKRPTSQPSRLPSCEPSTQPCKRPTTQPTRLPTSQPSAFPSAQPSSRPSRVPSMQPTSQPSRQPSCQPTKQPFMRPSCRPTSQPSSHPTSQPVLCPTSQPTMQPSVQPSLQPIGRPSNQPSNQPSSQPSVQPTFQPSSRPSLQPFRNPTSQPTYQPSNQPSSQPTSHPSSQPSSIPTQQPTEQPTHQPTSIPSSQPSYSPSTQPSKMPSCQPSRQPSTKPSALPSQQPTSQPTMQPTMQPSRQPSRQPVNRPTSQPTHRPSCKPHQTPSAQPSIHPSSQPSDMPSSQPSEQPSTQPSSQPTRKPTNQPTSQPTRTPTCQPTRMPTGQPSLQPFMRPTGQPSRQPTGQPSRQPYCSPTSQPSRQPYSRPSGQPSRSPSNQPTRTPTTQPTRQPFGVPTGQPSRQPFSSPTSQPSRQPTMQPTKQPFSIPTSQPSRLPTMQPSCQPVNRPTGQPSLQPFNRPTSQPSRQPTKRPSSQPTRLPTMQPSRQPSSQPSRQPSSQPTSQPSRQPTSQPSLQPNSYPSMQPSCQPFSFPTTQPTLQPINRPTSQPSKFPSSQPTGQPSRSPTLQPINTPSSQPSRQPSRRPSSQPSRQPSGQPSIQPTRQPSRQPTRIPSRQPTRQPFSAPTSQPSRMPSRQPTGQPTKIPSSQPSRQPYSFPTNQPTSIPSRQPSMQPTRLPSSQPSRQPTRQPTSQPSRIPSSQPSKQPFNRPTSQPSRIPTRQPTVQPTRVPSSQPSRQPTTQPSSQPVRSPTSQPTRQPSRRPSSQPSRMPSQQPSSQPTRKPTSQPSRIPSEQPSNIPSSQPSSEPSGEPTRQPSCQPSTEPTGQPTFLPIGCPTTQPTCFPSSIPSSQPLGVPTLQPFANPSSQPTKIPSRQPSRQPTGQPSNQPSRQPTGQPTCQPSRQPTSQPSRQPVGRPTSQPTRQPTSQPSRLPTRQPTRQPSRQPSLQPSSRPTFNPTTIPTMKPSNQPTSQPTSNPSVLPIILPTSSPTVEPTSCPSNSPSCQPTVIPSAQPVMMPSGNPTSQPTTQPTFIPLYAPSSVPSSLPTSVPSSQPSMQPSGKPSNNPFSSPTSAPTLSPVSHPSRHPYTTPSSQPTLQPIAYPSVVPSRQPASHPTTIPSSCPTFHPSGQPVSFPTSQPSSAPSGTPTKQPSMLPSGQPSLQPFSVPSSKPSDQPLCSPSGQPSCSPSSQPSIQPSSEPTSNPSSQPNSIPSTIPTSQPSTEPSQEPTGQPSSMPTIQPFGAPSVDPSMQPTVAPTSQPSNLPSRIPTMQPSRKPSSQPSRQPFRRPSSQPTRIPTRQPTGQPSRQPSSRPSRMPTRQPSSRPTRQPSSQPSRQPLVHPSSRPTNLPSSTPTRQPTSQPSKKPLGNPSSQPSSRPTRQPSGQPTRFPSSQPTRQPSCQPSSSPSCNPSSSPSAQPNSAPTGEPSDQPSAIPSSQPASVPSSLPTSVPVSLPTKQPVSFPSSLPSKQPINVPTSRPSSQPSHLPSRQPSTHPTRQPSSQPTCLPSNQPSMQPSCQPSCQPTKQPLQRPSAQPSFQPSGSPTSQPSSFPSLGPTTQPSCFPSSQPSCSPSQQPSSSPTVQPSGVPSSQPTQAFAAPILWKDELQQMLVYNSFNLSSSVTHQSTYFELNDRGISTDLLYGSCSNWLSTISNEFDVNSYTSLVESIKITSVLSLSPTAKAFNYDVISCNNVSSATLIVSLLRGLSASVNDFYSGLRVSCDAHQWSVKRCGSDSYPSLCVDCEDPCSSQNHCTNITNSLSIYAPYAISPCVTTNCSFSNESIQSQIRVFSVQYVESGSVSIVSISFVATKSTIRVTAVLNSPGSLYCGTTALQSTSNLQQQILLQNFANSSYVNVSTVLINGLAPNSTYHVRCLTISPNGNILSQPSIDQTLQNITTLCCKIVKTQLVSNLVMVGKVNRNAVKVTIDSMPITILSVRLAVFKEENDGSISEFPFALQPTSFTITPTSVAEFYSTLLVSEEGNFTISVYLSGQESSSFAISQEIVSFAVVSVISVVPAPKMLSAVFSGDGSYVSIVFDTKTNKGDRKTNFVCSELFLFNCSSTSMCVWSDETTVLAFVAGNSICATPGDVISVVSNATITAKCSDCNNNTIMMHSMQSGLPIGYPVLIILPTIELSAPKVIGPCDDLVLDGSTSIGSGGRDWSVISLKVFGDGNNTDIIQSYIDSSSITALSPPFSIPTTLLISNSYYSFSLMLCNFLNACGETNVQVIKRDSLVPTVSILGSMMRSMYRKNPLILTSLIESQSCNKSEYSYNYEWTVTQDGVRNLSLNSISRDPSRLLLSSYSLQVNAVYQILLTVTGTSSIFFASSARLTVVVVPGPVVAIISGGSRIAASLNRSTVVDASSSYDDDHHDADLYFYWQCDSMENGYSCKDFINDVDSGLSTFEVIPLNNATISSQFQLQVTVTDSQFVRYSTASTVVVLTGYGDPVATISSPAALRIINANEVLQLTSSILLPDNFVGTFSWMIDDSSYDLSKNILTPLNGSLGSESTSFFSAYLAVLPCTLYVGSSLTFSIGVHSSSSDYSVVTSVTVFVNSPPISGQYIVVPSDGIGLYEKFTFSARNWLDSDLPLLYQFGVYSLWGSRLALISSSVATYGYSILTAGSMQSNYTVQCFAEIVDSLSANTTTVATTRVVPAGKNQVNLYTFAKSIVDNSKQSIIAASSLLNTVDCTYAPDCTSLYREDCLLTTNTCGDCFIGYLGTNGNSNDACVLIPASNSRRLMSNQILHCNSTDQCSIFSTCESHRCVEESKQCPRNCSNNGFCYYINSDSGKIVNSCTISSSTCTAICSCDENYSLSIDCSKNNTEMTEIFYARDALVSSFVTNVIDMEDTSIQSVTNWIQLLSFIAQKPEELSLVSRNHLLYCVQSIIQGSSELGLNYFDTENMFMLINSILYSSGSYVSRSRRVLTMQVFPPKAGNNPISDKEKDIDVNVNVNQFLLEISYEIDRYVDIILQSMVPSQVGVSIVLSDLKMNIKSLSVQSFQRSVSIALPQSTLEEYAKIPLTDFQLPLSDISSPGNIVAAVYSISSRLYEVDDSFKSNPVQLFLGGSKMISNAFVVTLQNTASLSILSLPSYEYFNTTCFDGFSTLSDYTCMTGETQLVECNGSAGIIYSQCPYSYNASICSLLTDGIAPSQSPCSVLNVTVDNITCSCPTQSSSKRQLLGSFNAQVLSIVSMIERNYITYENVFVDSVEEVTLPKHSFIVYGIAISLLGCALAVAGFIQYAEYREHLRKRISPYMSKKDSVDGVCEYDRLIRYKPGLHYVESSLPFVYSSRSMIVRIIHELKNHHKYIRVGFSQSKVSVISIMSYLLSVLFFLCILMRYIDDDEDYCNLFNTQESCILQTSHFYVGQSQCEWKVYNTAPSSTFGYCQFLQPDRSIYIVLFASFFSALISIPIWLIVEYIVVNVLSISRIDNIGESENKNLDLRISVVQQITNDSLSCKVQNIVNRLSKMKAVVPTNNFDDLQAEREDISVQDNLQSNQFSASGKTLIREISESDADLSQQVNLLVQSFGLSPLTKEFGLDIVVELLSLLKELGLYRENLFLSARFEFDAIWGLNDDGNFFHEPDRSVWRYFRSPAAHQIVFADFVNSFRSARNALNKIAQFQFDNHKIESLILQLFHIDLLYGVKGKILESKLMREDCNIVHPSIYSFLLSWLFVILLDSGFLVAIIVLATYCTLERQRVILYAFLLWFFLDMIIGESIRVLNTHVVIPLCVSSSIKTHMAFVANSIDSSELSTNIEQESSFAFNSARFMFASHRLSTKFPDTSIGQVVSKYASVWPSPNSERTFALRHSIRLLTLLTSIFWKVVHFFIGLPLIVQDFFHCVVTTCIVWLIFWLHIEIYNIYPLIIILPISSVLLLSHFYFLHDRTVTDTMYNKWKKEIGQQSLVSPLSRKKRSKKGVFWNAGSNKSSKTPEANDKYKEPREDEESLQFVPPEYTGSDDGSGHFIAAQMGEYFSTKVNRRTSVDYRPAAHEEEIIAVDSGFHKFKVDDNVHFQLFGSQKVEFNFDDETEQKLADSDIHTELNDSSPLKRNRFASVADSSSKFSDEKDAHLHPNPFSEDNDSIFNVDFELGNEACNGISQFCIVDPLSNPDDSDDFFDLEYFRHRPVINGNIYETFRSSSFANSKVEHDQPPSFHISDNDDKEDKHENIDLEFLIKGLERTHENLDIKVDIDPVHARIVDNGSNFREHECEHSCPILVPDLNISENKSNLDLILPEPQIESSNLQSCRSLDVGEQCELQVKPPLQAEFDHGFNSIDGTVSDEMNCVNSPLVSMNANGDSASLPTQSGGWLASKSADKSLTEKPTDEYLPYCNEYRDDQNVSNEFLTMFDDDPETCLNESEDLVEAEISVKESIGDDAEEEFPRSYYPEFSVSDVDDDFYSTDEENFEDQKDLEGLSLKM